MDILEEIAQKTRERMVLCKERKTLRQLKEEAFSMNCDTGFPFEKALRQKGVSFICEVKRASPSKGLIAEEFPYVEIAKTYEEAGASAISVLTEPYYFQGADEYLSEIHQAVQLPLLRKDFIIDEYMIYEAKVMGASAVLFICSLLDGTVLKKYIEIADSLGLSALVEAHDEGQVMQATSAGARVVGVNNRDLRTFTVDIKNSIRLRKLVSEDVLFVSESGIQTAEDIRGLAENHVDAALIGETLMRSGNVKEILANMKEIGMRWKDE